MGKKHFAFIDDETGGASAARKRLKRVANFRNALAIPPCADAADINQSAMLAPRLAKLDIRPNK
jgi:hypothetical protein